MHSVLENWFGLLLVAFRLVLQEEILHLLSKTFNMCLAILQIHSCKSAGREGWRSNYYIIKLKYILQSRLGIFNVTVLRTNMPFR